MTKFLYVLVSGNEDIYYEQTLLSAITLRHYNPQAFISLIVDDVTEANLVGFRSEIKKLANEYKVISFPEKVTPLMRSRLLKTNMRNHIEGDFLYLDGDTVVVKSLEIPRDVGDIALVADLHAREKDGYRMHNKRFQKSLLTLNFSMSLENLYFNGGVIFAKDSAVARNFFNKWHELYLFCTEHSIYTDQFSLNESNHRLGFPIHELSGEWNCQIREAYNHLYRVKTIYPLLCKAKIIHFFGSGMVGKKEPHPLMTSEIFRKMKKEQRIDANILQLAYSAKNGFYGAPKKLNPKTKFPLFFLRGKFFNFNKNDF